MQRSELNIVYLMDSVADIFTTDDHHQSALIKTIDVVGVPVSKSADTPDFHLSARHARTILETLQDLQKAGFKIAPDFELSLYEMQNPLGKIKASHPVYLRKDFFKKPDSAAPADLLLLIDLKAKDAQSALNAKPVDELPRWQRTLSRSNIKIVGAHRSDKQYWGVQDIAPETHFDFYTEAPADDENNETTLELIFRKDFIKNNQVLSGLRTNTPLTTNILAQMNTPSRHIQT